MWTESSSRDSSGAFGPHFLDFVRIVEYVLSHLHGDSSDAFGSHGTDSRDEI